jgi:hypothetical protein
MGSFTKTTRAIIGLFTGNGSSSGSGSGQPSIPTIKPPIPLQKYLDKYVTQFADHLVPTTKPTLPADVDPDAYKRVAFSIRPLLSNAISSYYAGVFDDDTDFSASLVKVAALFAAGQFLSEAKSATSLAAFKTAVEARIGTKADLRIRNATFPPGSLVGVMPKISNVLTVSGSAVQFIDTGPNSFNNRLTRMIVESHDPSAAFCIDNLGYGYISTVLNEGNFFDSTAKASPDATTSKGRGIWLAGDYGAGLKIRIPCVNDHDDAQLTTARQMSRMFAMIRLNQLPENDTDTNAIMQNLLGQAPTWLEQHANNLHLSRNDDLTVAPLFTKVLAKLGFAGLGFEQRPDVFSEGLVIKWNNSSQVDNFNKKFKLDADNSLSGEIAVCWQNLLAVILPTGFDGIVEVLNNTISDFLGQ